MKRATFFKAYKKIFHQEREQGYRLFQVNLSLLRNKTLIGLHRKP